MGKYLSSFSLVGITWRHVALFCWPSLSLVAQLLTAMIGSIKCPVLAPFTFWKVTGCFGCKQQKPDLGSGFFSLQSLHLLSSVDQLCFWLISLIFQACTLSRLYLCSRIPSFKLTDHLCTTPVAFHGNSSS